MAVYNQMPPQQLYYQMNTKNQSFVNMHYYLQRAGIQNNKFFLVLFDRGLDGIDPYDERLSKELKIPESSSRVYLSRSKKRLQEIFKLHFNTSHK